MPDSSPKIIAIEDEDVIRQSIVAYLEDRNFSVIEAENGKIGLDLIRTEVPDLILTDLRMPEVNGLEVLAAVKKEFPENAVIVVFGTGELGDVVDTLHVGAWDYIPKPIQDMNILFHAVNKCLERSNLIKENKRYRQHLEELVEKRTADLEAAKQTLNSIISSIPDIIFRLDGNGKITFISNAVEKYGYNPVELIGKDVLEIVHDEDQGEVFRKIAERRTGDRATKSLEIRLRQKDEVFKEFDVKSKVIEDDVVLLFSTEGIYSTVAPSGENFVCTQGIARDITERKNNLLEKQKLEGQLFHAQKMESIGRLAGSLAHDFNNVLTSILGYAELLKLQLDEDSKESKAAEIICEGAERASRLTRQLLSFSRKEEQLNVPLDVNALIQGTVKITEKIFEKTVKIVKNFEKNINIIEADNSQLGQVFTNLVINAKDAMPEGGTLTITTENVFMKEEDLKMMPDLKEGDYIRVKVEDTGTGIPEEVKSHMFEPFFTTKSADKGTGLGLATVYGIIQRHNGHISVESELGQGTTFTLYFPVAQMTISPVVNNTQVVKGTGTILLVDDEDQIRFLGKTMLEKLGYKVILAEDGEKAISHYIRDEEKINLVILDMVMPKMTGSATFKKLKEINSEIKVVIASGFSREGKISEIIKEGVKGYIQKPFRMHELSKEIQSIINNP